MENISEQIIVFISTYGIKVLGAIIILVVGWIAAGIGRNVSRKGLERKNVDPSIVSFVTSLTHIIILVVFVLAAMSKFGIQTTSFVAILGAAGFAIGFALQGSLANFAAGILILLLKPYRVGDVIDSAGVLGKVMEIQLFTTILSTPDNIKIMVPNGMIFGSVIKNISAYDTRRVDMVIGIGYNSSISKACDVMLSIMKADTRILTDPEPQIVVAELADSSVNLAVRPWVNKDDYWNVKFDLTRKFKDALDENNIEIPFPQRVVHRVSETSEN